MISIDLITGYLGAGKTTFLNKYIDYLLDENKKIGLIINDYGPINIDMMFIKDSPNVIKEMIVSSDRVTYNQRLRSKLISLSLQKIDYLLIEPSGLFNMNDFFDVLNDDVIYDMYELKNIIGIFDFSLDLSKLDEDEISLICQELVFCNSIGITHLNNLSLDCAMKKINELIFNRYSANSDNPLLFDTYNISKDTFDIISKSGYKDSIYINKDISLNNFDCLFFMDLNIKEEILSLIRNELFKNDYGKVLRIKGFIFKNDSKYIKFNYTRFDLETKEVKNGQNVFIIIGKNLKKDKIESFFAKYIDFKQ